MIGLELPMHWTNGFIRIIRICLPPRTEIARSAPHAALGVFFPLQPFGDERNRHDRATERPGQVRFDSEYDDRKGKMRAVNVSLEGGRSVVFSATAVGFDRLHFSVG